jgi:ferredoxin--NADP+ reductase
LRKSEAFFCHIAILPCDSHLPLTDIDKGSAMSADATGAAAGAARVNPNAPTEETVLAVEHYTDRLFRFRITRPRSFRFRSGEFVMIGLPKEDGRPLLRAYSVASPPGTRNWSFIPSKCRMVR